MAGRYRKLLRAFKREAVQFLVAKNLVISHLPLEALPQPIKLQMRPQDGTWSLDILRFAVSQPKPDA